MSGTNILLYLGILVVAVSTNKMLDECLSGNRKYTMNVVLLEDNTYEWNRPFVQAAVQRAIEEDRLENKKHGMNTLSTSEDIMLKIHFGKTGSRACE